MFKLTASLNRGPWWFWPGLAGIGVVYVLASIAIHTLPGKRDARDERARLCAQAVTWIMSADDMVALERGKFIVKELDCDLG